MIPNLDLESKVIEQFVSKNKQERYLTLIRSNGKRKKFISELAHFKELVLSRFDNVNGNIQEQVRLRVGNLKTCYAISENKEIDALEIQVDIALSKVIGYGMGTLLVFGDAEFIYFEGEDANNRWLSK